MSVINKIVGKLFGNKSARDIKNIEPILTNIREEYEKIKHLSNDGLRDKSLELKHQIQEFVSEDRAKIQEFRDKIEKEEIRIEEREEVYEAIDDIEKDIDRKMALVVDDILPVAFSVIKETAQRFVDNKTIEVTASEFDKKLATKKDYVKIVGEKAIYSNSWMAGGNEVVWNMVHYDVQLIGGIVLHQGKIAEMGTGEGKTLVATLPVFLNALTDRGVHIVTVNSYLSKRDSEWMGPIYQFHGLSVDCIDRYEPNSEDRRNAYKADITFGTNNEFGFDYLRDNMSIRPNDLVQRKHNYAIVDEVDSVLIDDARTPLIISGPVPKSNEQQFQDLRVKIEKIVRVQQKLVNKLFTEAKQLISASSSSKDMDKGGLLLLRVFKGLPKMKSLINYLSEQGNKALLLKTENFYMQDNSKKMHVVTDELYFIIDEKHNAIELTDKGIDLITSHSDDASFFILPDIGSEIAKIESSNLDEIQQKIDKDKLVQDFTIKSERVHTVNQLLKAYTLFEKDVEYVVIDNKVKIVDEQTGRIMEGRRYSDGLHQAIEAKENVKVEAASQTLATITLQNYFRMYDKLAGMTGTAETEAGELWNIYKLDVVVIPSNKPIVRKDDNDLVYKTRKEKFQAIIEAVNRLVQEGRPVLVGTTSVEISELLSRALKTRGIKHNVLNAKLHQREADIVAEAGKKGVVTIATNMAGRGTDIKLTSEVKEAGGLAIVGTERHESRRVDRQLRGRSGRQGDPGSSLFFVALEDNLMRLFSSDRIIKIMDRLGLKEGEVIQHSMISRSIERAQKKVEENNFGMRKRLLEYDDVMNSQREVIYKKRRHALFGERLGVDIANMFYDICDKIVCGFHEAGDYEGFKLELLKTLSLPTFDMGISEWNKASTNEITEIIYKNVLEIYHNNKERLSHTVYPVIKEMYDNKSYKQSDILVPITDGKKVYQVIANIEKVVKTEGKELSKVLEKTAILSNIDEIWKEHLREMDDLKQSVQNASYEQKDPLLIYKFESFGLFKVMLEKLNDTVVCTLLRTQIYGQEKNQIQEARTPQNVDRSRFRERKDELPQRQQITTNREEQKTAPVRVEKKIGRNDPCLCGSGKKYKQCHGM